MLNDLPFTMVRCLILTLLIECGMAFVIGIRDKWDFLYITLVNIITNPLVVVSVFIINIFFGSKEAAFSEYFIEIIVFLVEGLIYKKLLSTDKLNPFIISLILNSASYLTGELINYFILH